MTEPLFTVSREDWSLHRKGYQDQTRHQQKVRDAIKQNLPDLVTEENIILSDGKQIIKVPIRSLDEYRFRYNHNKGKHVGQGDGNSKVGDVLGVDPAPAQGPGKGQGAGDQAGKDYYEAEVNLEELQTLLFEELELPNLKQKENHDLSTKEIIFLTTSVKKGIMSNIDKKRTILENLKRNSTSGNPGIHGITPDDLRFKTWEEVVKPHSNALILAMMDTSGSMGTFEKICRAQLLLLDDPIPQNEIREGGNRVYRPPYRSQSRDGRGIFHQRRKRRDHLLLCLPEGPGADRPAVPSFPLQYLSFSLLGRRQSDLG